MELLFWYLNQIVTEWSLQNFAELSWYEQNFVETSWSGIELQRDVIPIEFVNF